MRRVLLGTVTVLSVLGLLTACSSSSASIDIAGGVEPSKTAVTTTPGSAPSPSSPAFDDLLTATAPAAPGKIGPVRVLTSPHPGDLSVAWKLLGISEGDQQLVVRYIVGSSGCQEAAGFTVVETSKTVTLTAFSRPTAAATGDCAADLRLGTGYLDLKAPLGKRALVHAAVDPNWSNID